MAVVSQSQSFSLFVYPFVFVSDIFPEIVKKVGEAQFKTDPDKALTVWQPASFPKEDLLLHVSRYLNPTTENILPTAKIWNITNNALSSPLGLGGRADWKIHAKQTDENGQSRDIEIPFRIKNLQLALFRTGIGFLTIEAAPKSDNLADWLNFLHYFRFIRRQNISLSALNAVDFDEQSRDRKLEPFFPLGKGDSNGRGKFHAILCELLNQFSTDCADVFIPDQLLPYAALFVNNHPVDEDFQVVYKLRNFFHSEQGKNPAPSDLRSDHPSLLEYGEREWQIFSHDGGAFLAFDAPDTDFFRVSLPQHLRNQYFLLFILALQQRFALINYSVRIGEDWFGKDESHRFQAFEKIRDDFFDFATRGYFVQVMQREHHHRCYWRWQEIFQVEHFYQNVRHKIQEIHEHLQMRRTKQIKDLSEKQAELIEEQDRKINILSVSIALLFGLPSLIIGFLGINLKDVTIPEANALNLSQAAMIVGFPLSLGLIISFILFHRFSKKKK
jgi:hypothetical protein